MKQAKIYLVISFFILLVGALAMFILSWYSFLLYLAIIVIIGLPIYLYGHKIDEINKHYVNEITGKIRDSSNKGVNKFPIGIIILDDNKKIEWANNFVYNQLNISGVLGKDILDVLPDIRQLFDDNKSIDNQFEIDSRFYKVVYQKDSGYIYFFDITDSKVILQRFKDTRPAVMTINIDNIEELLDDLDDVVGSNLYAKVTMILTEWATRYGVYLKRIDEDRFLGLLNVKNLKEIEDDKFSILDEIRELKKEYDAQITLSIGVGTGTDFLPELGELSKTALDLSLGRGGDQVAIKEVNGDIKLYGGKTNPQEKRTRIKARVLSNALLNIVSESDKIIVMGHKRPDFDAIGSCIGIYEFSKILGKECYIVLNEEDKDYTLNKIMEEISHEKELYNAFVDSDTAWDLMTPMTTLVVVDTSDADRVIDIGLLSKANKRVVIDHHRRGENIIANPLLTYVEPYASSASELITELLEYQLKNKKMLPLSATIMLGGMVVDSQNFSIRTGSRTFEAASYLRANGADPVKIKTILKEPIENLINRAQIISNSEQIAEGLVVALAPSDKIYDNVLLAQSADLLLTIKGVEASFVVGYLDKDKVGISARSLGKKNVQLVMERLGGGGHLANAATQIASDNIYEVKNLLVEVIKEILVEE